MNISSLLTNTQHKQEPQEMYSTNTNYSFDLDTPSDLEDELVELVETVQTQTKNEKMSVEQEREEQITLEEEPSSQPQETSPNRDKSQEEDISEHSETESSCRPKATRKAATKRAGKGSFYTKEEDEKVLALFAQYGTDWLKYKDQIPGRTYTSIRYHYESLLDPNRNTTPLTTSEKAKLLRCGGGNNWPSIGEQFQGRPLKWLQDQYYHLKGKKYTKPTQAVTSGTSVEPKKRGRKRKSDQVNALETSESKKISKDQEGRPNDQSDTEEVSVVTKSADLKSISMGLRPRGAKNLAKQNLQEPEVIPEPVKKKKGRPGRPKKVVPSEKEVTKKPIKQTPKKKPVVEESSEEEEETVKKTQVKPSPNKKQNVEDESPEEEEESVQKPTPKKKDAVPKKKQLVQESPDEETKVQQPQVPTTQVRVPLPQMFPYQLHASPINDFVYGGPLPSIYEHSPQFSPQHDSHEDGSIANWLASLKMPELIVMFEKVGIHTVEDLLNENVDSEFLIKIGITGQLYRLVILEEVASLKDRSKTIEQYLKYHKWIYLADRFKEMGIESVELLKYLGKARVFSLVTRFGQ